MLLPSLFSKLNNAESALSRVIPCRPRVTDSSSATTFGQIRRWIEACDTHHKCWTGPKPLPTRVLDVGESSKYIRLVETQRKNGRFIALSHCWGQENVQKTTRGNYRSQIEGIELRYLSETFRDAVQTARALAIRYLWIDSLCIIQDDEDDWKREASMMAEVYANTFVTLAATSAPNGTHGCFAPWEVRRQSERVYSDEESCTGAVLSDSIVPWLETRGDDDRGIAYLSKGPNAILNKQSLIVHWGWLPPSTSDSPKYRGVGTYGIHIDPVKDQPLNLRGWTFQERILSPRILHFAVDQIYWQCRRLFEAEDGSRYSTKFVNVDRLVQRQQLPPIGASVFQSDPLFQKLPPSSLGRIGKLSGGWLEAVELYSLRQLTYAKDKLPAMAGLASYVRQKTNESYHAGLWGNHIWENLFWAVRGTAERTAGDNTCAAEYHAPSWSWASLDAPVTFIPPDADKIVAELIIVYTKHSGPYLHGAVSGGFIKIWVRYSCLNSFQLICLLTPYFNRHHCD